MGAFDAFADIPPDTTSPWSTGAYHANTGQLQQLLSKCVVGGKWSESQGGVVGAALDLWVARELRRAGYEDDAVWPREQDPRVLPASVARAVRRLSKTDKASRIVDRIVKHAGSAGPSVFGEFFGKSVDVLVADWDRGVEVMVSTKGMTSSFGKNLTNRWEEFAGDLRNLRGRFPLAVLGITYMSDAKVVEAPKTFARMLDMLRKLRLETAPSRAYDATTLILASPSDDGVRLEMDQVPEDLHPGQFFDAVLSRAFERLPVSERDQARKLYGGRELPTAEAKPADGPKGPEPEKAQ
jgi:hypothetical protein